MDCCGPALGGGHGGGRANDRAQSCAPQLHYRDDGDHARVGRALVLPGYRCQIALGILVPMRRWQVFLHSTHVR